MEKWKDGKMERWITQHSSIPIFQYSSIIMYYPEKSNIL